jgi:UDP-3-O-[3-hydroxymyristoyl] glucosamine N-acyltransferase
LAELAALAGCELADPAAGDKRIVDVAPLERARADELSFYENTKYRPAFEATAAGACVTRADHAAGAPPALVLLLSDEPYKAYARIAQAFYPPDRPPAGISPAAHVGEDVTMGRDCSIAPGAVVLDGASVGDRSAIGPNAVVGRGVVIGADCAIGANVSLSHCLIGDRVTIHQGASIGQDGFGFAPDPAGHVKVPQLGLVRIGNDCDIGANTTIDRGSSQDTVVGDNCWIDNLVQIAHNVQLGRGCILAAQVGVSGSTKIGDFAVFGGQAGIAGHLTIGPGAQIGAQGGVLADIPPGAKVTGTPARPIQVHYRQLATLARITKGKR